MKQAIRTCVFAVLSVTLAMASISASSGNNYYRWFDDRGNPVHSDRPPPKGVDYEVISTGSSMVREVEAEEGAVPAEVNPTAGNEFEQVDAAANRAKKNPEYCQRARENLETLNTAARIRLRNDQGELRYLSEEEKEAQRKEARDAIAAHCE